MLVRHANGSRLSPTVQLSNAMRSGCRTFALVIASTLWVKAVNGQTPYAGPVNPPWAQVTDLPASPPGTQRETMAAEIVFVGVTENTARLAQIIDDLLRVHGIVARFEQRAQLTENDLLAQQQLTGPERATVWILVPNSAAARLVFADYAHQRFLIREIPLLVGLDDFGRESIGQVVESSLLALLQGATEVSHAEVRTALGPYLAASSETPGASEPRQSSPTPAEPAGSKSSQRTWCPRLGLSYGLSLTGNSFGLQQGPGITSGLEFVRSTDSLFVTAAFEWQFERYHQTSDFDLAVQNNLVWLLFGWRKPIRDANFLAILGPGLELDRVNPKLATTEADASVQQHRVRPSPWARMAIGLEWDDSPITLQLLGKIDVSAYQTHYNIEDNGNSVELASTWSVQPGVVLAALWR